MCNHDHVNPLGFFLPVNTKHGIAPVICEFVNVQLFFPGLSRLSGFGLDILDIFFQVWDPFWGDGFPYGLPSLKQTRPLKMDGWKMIFPFGAIWAYFQVLLLLVSGRVEVSNN